MYSRPEPLTTTDPQHFLFVSNSTFLNMLFSHVRTVELCTTRTRTRLLVRAWREEQTNNMVRLESFNGRQKTGDNRTKLYRTILPFAVTCIAVFLALFKANSLSDLAERRTFRSHYFFSVKRNSFLFFFFAFKPIIVFSTQNAF